MAGIVCFFIGGTLYTTLEHLYRRRSHPSMFVAGGLSLVLIGGLVRAAANLPLIVLAALSALLITALEFLFGTAVNLCLNWDVWDYSDFRFQLYGQISLVYSVLWFLLSVPAVWLFRLVFAPGG